MTTTALVERSDTTAQPSSAQVARSRQGPRQGHMLAEPITAGSPEAIDLRPWVGSYVRVTCASAAWYAVLCDSANPQDAPSATGTGKNAMEPYAQGEWDEFLVPADRPFLLVDVATSGTVHVSRR